MPALPRSVALTGHRVALLGRSADPGSIPIWLWDYETRKTTIINISTNSFSVNETIVLHPHEEALCVMNIEKENAQVESRGSIIASKYDVLGQMLSCQRVQTDDALFLDPLHRLRPCLNQEYFTTFFEGVLFSRRRSGTLVKTGQETGFASYDMRTDTFSCSKEPEDERAMGCQTKDMLTRLFHFHQNILVEDVIYTAGAKEGCLDSIFIRASRDPSHMWETEMSQIERSWVLEGRYSGGVAGSQGWSGLLSPWIFGDDRFFVVFGGNEVHIWCFDEDVLMANEDRSYREERTKRARARAEARRGIWSKESK